jgi:hypothetical protein
MLSPHEFSTLLLIEHSPFQVEPRSTDLANLQREKLVRIESGKGGELQVRLTSRGYEVLGRLQRFFTRQTDYAIS